MATIKLIPSTYYLSSTQYLSVSNPTNMYEEVSTADTDYAQVYNSRSSTTSYYIYIRGFNFDDIPSNAIVSDFTIRLRGYYSGGYSQNMYLYDGTSTSMGSASSLTTSVATREFTCNYSWDDIVAAGSDFGIRINCRRNSRNTAAYYYIYGAEIEVEYTVPDPRTITSTLSGNGTINPSGANTYYDGDGYELTITPTNKSDTVTLLHNGIDVSSQLVAHGVGSIVTIVPDNVTTSGIQSGESYAEYAIGNSAENPSSSGTSSNMYASSGSTGYAAYSFDFSSIPSNATIESIEVRCYGHRESSSIDSSHVSQCVLYQGSNAISDEVDFPYTSNSMITIEPTTMPTRAQLDNVTVRHYVGYYGGLVLGISFEITYSTGSGIDHYTYTFTVSGNSILAVTIGTATAADSAYFKVNGTWRQVSQIYKKINGSWVLQTDYSQIFDSTVKYKS